MDLINFGDHGPLATLIVVV